MNKKAQTNIDIVMKKVEMLENWEMQDFDKYILDVAFDTFTKTQSKSTTEVLLNVNYFYSQLEHFIKKGWISPRYRNKEN